MTFQLYGESQTRWERWQPVGVGVTMHGQRIFREAYPVNPVGGVKLPGRWRPPVQQGRSGVVVSLPSVPCPTAGRGTDLLREVEDNSVAI